MPDSELVQWFLCLHGLVLLGRFDIAGKCHILYVPVKVVTAREAVYTPLNRSDTNPKINCPENVKDLCKAEKGVFSWDRVCHQTLYQLSNPDLLLNEPCLTCLNPTCSLMNRV